MPTPNTSATGGYLAPTTSPYPLEGRALLRFFQAIIVGITSLPGDMVRPYWQSEPPNVPTAGEAWCAFKIVKKPSDEYPYVGFTAPPATDTVSFKMQRHEEMNILTTFYDLGSTGVDDSGGQADYNVTLLRDGLLVPQNREPLFRAGMGLVKTGDLITVPIVLKQRWQYRVDLDWVVRRQINRIYPVTTIVSATGDINYDTGLPAQPFNAT